MVAAFLLVVIWWGSAKAENLVEIGPSQVGSNFSTGFMLTMTERVRDKYDFTLGYISKQNFSVCDRPDCEWDVKEQIFFGVEYLVPSPWTDRLRIGIGPYLFQRPDRIGTDTFRIGLDIEYRFARWNERFGIRIRHFSLAGSGDVLEICRPQFGCVSNDWNTGQDSWVRGVYYFGTRP